MLKWLSSKTRQSTTDEKSSLDRVVGSDDRKRISSLVSFMGDHVCNALIDAIRSMQDRDVHLAQRVIDGDDVIDITEIDINKECLASIAMRNPVRSELRFIFAVLKITTDLERIGDQAVNVAQRALVLAFHPLLKPLIDIPKMSDMAVSMVSRSLQAFFEEDTDLAVHVFRDDKKLDQLAEAVSEELTDIIKTGLDTREDLVTVAMELLLTVRHLERIGDHASNISERVFFMVRGERLKDVVLGKKRHSLRE
ncbi:MAG: phosphate transport system regulatory protein PhoU [Dethiosulfovibrio peptidovorans]|nr:MAG: phosphate transport system regulatory protein PhoU [Dethiosulfovibrio peptidovorans]